MPWKTKKQLLDLGSWRKLEATCQMSGRSRYPNIHEFATLQNMAYDYIDVVESDLFCVNRGCTGKNMVALIHLGETEGFER